MRSRRKPATELMGRNSARVERDGRFSSVKLAEVIATAGAPFGLTEYWAARRYVNSLKVRDWPRAQEIIREWEIENRRTSQHQSFCSQAVAPPSVPASRSRASIGPNRQEAAALRLCVMERVTQSLLWFTRVVEKVPSRSK
jgi:hypothetical protein